MHLNEFLNRRTQRVFVKWPAQCQLESLVERHRSRFAHLHREPDFPLRFRQRERWDRAFLFCDRPCGSGFRQRFAVDLAVRRQRQAVQRNEHRRHHVFRQLLLEDAAELDRFRRRT